MLFFSLGAVIYLLIFTGWIIKVPYLFKSAAPINFLIPPFAYIYIRSVLKDEQKFKASDYYHFIPAILVFINYIPVYFMPATEKQALVQSIVDDFSHAYLSGNGYISDKYLFICRMAQSILYLYFQWKLVLSYKKELLLDKYTGHTNEVIKWLKTFNILFTTSIFGYILLFIIVAADPKLGNSEQVLMIPGYVLSFSFLGLSTYLLIHPQVLFGLPYFKSSAVNSLHDLHIAKRDPVAAPKDYDEEIYALKKHFEDSWKMNGLSFDNAQAGAFFRVGTGISLPDRNFTYKDATIGISLIRGFHFSKPENFNTYLQEQGYQAFEGSPSQLGLRILGETDGLLYGMDVFNVAQKGRASTTQSHSLNSLRIYANVGKKLFQYKNWGIGAMGGLGYGNLRYSLLQDVKPDFPALLDQRNFDGYLHKSGIFLKPELLLEYGLPMTKRKIFDVVFSTSAGYEQAIPGFKLGGLSMNSYQSGPFLTFGVGIRP